MFLPRTRTVGVVHRRLTWTDPPAPKGSTVDSTGTWPLRVRACLAVECRAPAPMTPGGRATAIDTDAGPSRARIADRVRVRSEAFGAVVYVGRRDHFFALDARYAKLVRRFQGESRRVAADDRDMVRALAGM